MNTSSVGNKKKKIETEEELQEALKDIEDLTTYIRDLNFFLPIAVGTVSAAGKIVDANRAFGELLGCNPAEIIGKKIEDIFLEKEKIKKINKEIRELKTIKNKELTLINKKGEKLLVSFSASLRVDKEGNLFGYFISLSDITELKNLQKNLQREVEKRTRELQKRVMELEKFHQLTIGREMRMMELKKEIERLKSQIGELKEKMKSKEKK